MNTIQPVLLTLGPLQIRWYGLMYALSFLLVYWYVLRQIKSKRFEMTEKQLDTFMMWLVVALIIGARLVEVIYYHPSFYIQNPLRVFAFWSGGLSFHGGLIGMFFATYMCAKRWKISVWKIADVFIVPLALAQALGRFGNFTNHELFGHVTNSFFGVNFNGERDVNGLVYRHPSQLYEAFYDIVIFGILLYRVAKYKPQEGTQFALFLILYGTFRSITEVFRVSNFTIGPFTAGQLLNIPMIIVGVLLWIYLRKSTQ